MQIVADLHSHSRYSRAVSPRMNLDEVALWSAKKGIDLVATGDWNHPLWLKEIREKLEETAEGIFRLRDDTFDYSRKVNFLLSTELATAYTEGGRGRKAHHLIFSPSFETSEKIVKELQRRGFNLMYDGRPILGISCRNLLELILAIDERCLMIPAHAWTPWFGIFGSKSGFDSLGECFGDLEKYIYGVETGLSSDPVMNWGIKKLAGKSILSFSDAHSAPKLGREATVFTLNVKRQALNSEKLNVESLKFNYDDLADAIKQKPDGKLKIGYTIEFFPEEGKYHWTGHRDCGIKYSPKEVKEKGITCPVCTGALTVGVENRVLDLSYKDFYEDLALLPNKVGTTFVYDKEKSRTPFVSLIPLLEVLLETNSNSPTKASFEYEKLTSTFASEFDILLRKSYEQINASGGVKLAQAIKIIRERKAYVDPGFDGVFGKVKIFQDDKKQETRAQETNISQQTLF